MKLPRVSIILPTFERPALLRQTLAGVFAQTFREYELIIVDDGSGEETRQLLHTYASHPAVRLIERPHCGQPTVNRNAGLRVARGEYLAFLDSDDLWAPDKLARQLEQFESGAPGQWSYTGFTCIDEQGRRLAADEQRRWYPYSGDILRQAITGAVSIRLPTVMARRVLVERVGGFDEQAPTELDLWIRLAEHSPVQVIDAPLAAIRTHSENFSANWASAYARRELSLRKIEHHFTGTLRQLVRRERVRNCLALSAESFRRGTAGETVRAWWSGVRYSWSSFRWWYNGARFIVRSPGRPARGNR